MLLALKAGAFCVQPSSVICVPCQRIYATQELQKHTAGKTPFANCFLSAPAGLCRIFINNPSGCKDLVYMLLGMSIFCAGNQAQALQLRP